MTTSEFYQAGPLSQIAINLFYGWGYNFYRLENQLRSDDLLIRSKAGWLLGLARGSVEKAEIGYRRASIATPTREKPFPDPGVMTGVQALERLSKTIGALEAQIRSQPVPENDRMSQLYRSESALLVALADCDHRLVGQADLLRAKLDGKNGTAILEGLDLIEDGLAAIEDTLRRRQAISLEVG